VRPRLAERDEHVGGGEQAGGRVQLGTADAGRVPGSVHTLVMAARYQSQRAKHRGPCQDRASVVRVQAHLFPLLRPQRVRPLPHAGRHRDPAQVMHQPGPVDSRRVGGTDQPGRRPRQRGDPREWPVNHGLFRSTTSPNPARASSKAASAPNVRGGPARRLANRIKVP
jgi:hypothetical protein